MTKTQQQPITQSRQHGAQTTSAHLYWCGANPSGPWPAPVASHEGHAPKGFTFSPFWRAFGYVHNAGQIEQLEDTRI